jgi:cell division protein DivIC
MTLKQLKNKPIIKIITNKYVIILSIFIIWMVFFDENSLLNHMEFNKEIDKLESEKEYYKSEIYKDSSLIHKLENKKELEKFAREQYNMKKENEDIYLIEYDTIIED